ncbi:TPA: glycosyltransferase [Aeromonas salmonicida subsp. salmonicida]|uniref:glycosyltransferase n=1 Tax=Aeromonas salmonicida TaxID=645 RepID=UPI001F485BD7|nr:glycosyltransferase [Aeromonas salmonicida]
MKNNELWVVLGMHRSGTSAMSKALAVLGAQHGNYVTAAADDNPKGFWEDAEIVAFNDGLLGSLGIGWFDLAEIPQGIFDLPYWHQKRAQARLLMQARLADCSCFALKDPRLCRLLPFWQSVWSDLDVRVRYVVSLREPGGVMQSLLTRNQFYAGYSAALWLRHLFDIVNGLGSNNSALVVDYSALLSAPAEQLMRMSTYLERPCDVHKLTEFVSEFLDRELNHGAIAGDSPLCDLAEYCYRQICSLEQISNRTAAILDPCLPAFSALTQAMREDARYIDGLHNSKTWHQLGERHEQTLFDLNSQIVRIDAEISEYNKQLRGEINRLDATALVRDEAQREHARWLKQLSTHLAEQQKNYSHLHLELQQQLAELQSDYSDKIAELELTLGKQDHLITEQKSQLQQLATAQTAELQHLYASVFWKRRLAKRYIATLYRRTKPIIRPFLTLIPTFIAQRIKALLDNCLLNKPVMSPAAMPVYSENIVPDTADFQPSPLVNVARHAPTNGLDIIVFPVIDWAFRIQRPQHLARELAALGHRVFYLTTTFHHSKQPGFVLQDNPAPNVFICQLNLAGIHPIIYQTLQDSRVLKNLYQSVEVLRQQLNIKRSVALIDLPFWHLVAAAIPACQLVYDCMDHHAGFSTNSEEMHQQECKLLHSADLVITTAARLSEHISRERENTVVRNAAEVSFFSKKTEQYLYHSDRPVVGYYGAISEWFDIDLVITAAKNYPQWDFVLVGNTFGCDTKNAEKIENIHFIGEVPYSDLLGYLNAFDICTIPFKLVELTMCTNPVKVYEYLAAGKPVVATAMPEVQLIEKLLHIAHSSEDFITKLDLAMKEVGNEALSQERSDWAKQHDWASRAYQLSHLVSEITPKVSVIVLTYNNLDMTKACLDSIERFTHYPNLELIIVDNASSDNTPEFLREYAESKGNVTVCLNDKNLGFSAGNNVGLKIATGDYLVILNNDTYVTEGWLDGLIRALKRNPELGLVGPVTNNIGNEAKININYNDMLEMAVMARKYTYQHIGKLYLVDCAAFFCVMFSRKVYEDVGLMEEAFGVGFFEDDDYCNRVRAAGYQIAVVEDVFVHHHLSASFDKLKVEVKQALFEKNKVIYEKKWGAWVPHKYRPGVH